VPLGHRRHWFAIRLADDRDHLLFRKTRFAHRSLRIGSQSLNLAPVRKSGSRSGTACGPSASAPPYRVPDPHSGDTRPKTSILRWKVAR
jgi:hypothetical protein